MASHIRFDYMYSDFRAIKECIRRAKNFSKKYPVTCNPPHWGNIDGFAKRFGWDFCNPPDYLSNDTELRKVYNAALKRNCNIAKSSNKLDLDKLTNHIEKARAQSCSILSGEAEKERKAVAEAMKKRKGARPTPEGKGKGKGKGKGNGKRSKAGKKPAKKK